MFSGTHLQDTKDYGAGGTILALESQEGYKEC